MSDKQKTLSNKFEISGKGLHTGMITRVVVKPDKENSGIKFCRVDLPSKPVIEALADNVVETSRSTVIAKDDAKVATIEHLMAALWGMGIDNALVEVEGPEIPILDGSAAVWVKLINEAGIVDQSANRKYFEVEKHISYRMDERDSELTIYPDNNYTISVHVDFKSNVVGKQYAAFDSDNSFEKAIAPCRTFVFFHEMAPLIEAGYIKGGDLSNAIVVIEKPIIGQQAQNIVQKIPTLSEEILGNPGYVTEGGLRFENEIARHKMLDLMGDMSLVGIRLKGHVLATRPGHSINTEFAKVIRKNIRMAEESCPYKIDANAKAVFDIEDIKRILPHRSPMLLVDKVVKCDSERIVGLKQVSSSDPYFEGHFPEEAIMPGVLQVEALAQCGGILVLSDVEKPQQYSTYFLKLDDVKFRHKVVPGDTLILVVDLIAPVRHGIGIMNGRAYVGKNLVCEATMTVLMQKKDSNK